MHFLAPLALLLAVLVAGPYFAHRLRRRRATERLFAATHLVPPALPQARRRSAIEDRALLAVRGLSILALALLAASPFVRCSRVALERSGGASVAMAIVIDDSMSMRAPVGGGGSRFDAAQKGARELLNSAREGDAVAIVLAGDRPRIALGATTDLSAARHLIGTLAVTDRATDLEGALSLAQALVASLPQVDHRVVLFSDLADGHSDAAPLGEGFTIPLWAPLPQLAHALGDCAILRAARTSSSVRVRFACGPAAALTGRSITVTDGKEQLARVDAPALSSGDVVVPLQDASRATVAKLSGSDAVASDDEAPIIDEGAVLAVAVVSDGRSESETAGGASVIEQALTALKLEMSARPIPAFPDRAEETAPFAAIAIDDPAGFTPEQRLALKGFVERGGLLLVGIGPRAANPPIGSSFEPLLDHPIAWESSPVTGATVDAGATVEWAGHFADVGSASRAKMHPDDAAHFDAMVRWGDREPLVARRAIGLGEVWVVTLPFAPEITDFSLRPGFLMMLDSWVGEAASRAAPRRTDVGATWSFPSARDVRVDGPRGPVAVKSDRGVLSVVPESIGLYRVRVDGKEESRVAMAMTRELDLRPRKIAPSAAATNGGAQSADVDGSWVVALALLALLAGDIALRGRARKRDTALV